MACPGHPLIGFANASAEAYHQQLRRDEEQAVIEAIREHGELVWLEDDPDSGLPWIGAWAAPNRGDGKGWGNHHSNSVVQRLAKRGVVVVVRGTRVVLAP
jgi:hypothetical protein